MFSKWREGVGGRLRYFVSGGAPLSPALSYSFLAAGIPILQGYGATETCIVSANRPGNNHVGSVGIPFEGIEIKDCRRRRDSCAWSERDARLLRSAGSDCGRAEGWLVLHWRRRSSRKDGQLYITDRKKDLFKLSNGKYVAPQLIESLLKQSEFVSQVVVVGTGRKQPVALIVPEWESLNQALAEAGEEAPKDREALSRFPAGDQDRAAGRRQADFVAG